MSYVYCCHSVYILNIFYIGDCATNSDCDDGSFCRKICSTDTYVDHRSLLAAAVNLTGNSYVSVSPNRYPNFPQNLAIVAKLSQRVNNNGYLLFYGTSGSQRNLGIYLTSNSTVTWLSFYYTDVMGDIRNRHLRFSPSLADGMEHCLAVNIFQSEFAVYVDGDLMGGRDFTAPLPDFTYGVSYICY